ncbi:hypothetical protein FHS55_004561 [Angulomicrobium tetraedrale]|uniref:Uncharacterized protein n=1 Tax=Ancylobacter tetraedralis TaxID=217068 RepID=A0A839ZH98_9HYPH|nr:hypothetical protein [Ancylobacter tetraedralis]MBB3773915.1 hypothetical protein [Ancylobacter tetraedralis]
MKTKAAEPARGSKARGKRTPGHMIGRTEPGDWALSQAQWLKVGEAYCPAFCCALLAEIAIRAAEAERHADGPTALAEAQQRATRARNAYHRHAKLHDLSERTMEVWAHKAAEWKEAITEIVNRYISQVKMEAEAPPVADTMAWMSKLGRAAADLLAAYEAPLNAKAKSLVRADLERAMGGAPRYQDVPDEALADVAQAEIALDELIEAAETQEHREVLMAERDALSRNLEESAVDSIRLSEVMDGVRQIVFYASDVAKNLDDEPAFVDGSAWARWIIDLTGFCKWAGLPISAGRELRVNGEPSEFVALVNALTDTLPPGCSRHETTRAALAKAIGEARKKADNLRKAREAAEA